MTPTERLQAQLNRAVVARRANIPEAGRLVWRWFLDLSMARSYGPHGPNPLSYAEIDAWQRVTRTPLEPHHVTLLRAMDDAWLTHARDELRQAAGGGRPNTLPPVSKQEINPALFDAMFQ